MNGLIYTNSYEGRARNLQTKIKMLLGFLASGISGLVAEYIVAIDVTRVRFPADALSSLFELCCSYICHSHMGHAGCHCYIACVIFCMSARSVAASYKPPMLVTRARLPACAFFFYRSVLYA